MSNLPEMWIIRNSKTGEIWRADSGKSSWKAKGHAKNAWAGSYNSLSYSRDNVVDKRCAEIGVEKVFDRQYQEVNYYRVPYFDEQDVYVLEEMHYGVTLKLNKAEAILKDLLNNCECGEQVDTIIKGYFNIE